MCLVLHVLSHFPGIATFRAFPNTRDVEMDRYILVSSVETNKLFFKWEHVWVEMRIVEKATVPCGPEQVRPPGGLEGYNYPLQFRRLGRMVLAGAGSRLLDV
jgi:hypothetical protein